MLGRGGGVEGLWEGMDWTDPNSASREREEKLLSEACRRSDALKSDHVALLPQTPMAPHFIHCESSGGHKIGTR